MTHETSPTSLVKWQYADWDSSLYAVETADCDKLYSLRLHIQEVSGFVLDSQAKGRSVKLSADYLPGLIAQKERLEAKIEQKSTARKLAGRFGVSRFVRGGGP